MGQPPKHPLQPTMPSSTPVSTPDAPGRLLGELARSDQRWNVFLETHAHSGARGFRAGDGVAGRLHFVDGSRRRTTTWIFLEWSEQEVLARFNEFSPVELWKMVESLA